MSGIEGPGVIGGGGGGPADWNTMINIPPEVTNVGLQQPANIVLANGSQAQGLLFTAGTLEMAAGTDLLLGADTITLTSIAVNNLGAPGSINNQALPASALVWHVGTDNANNTFTGVAAPAEANRQIYLQNVGGTGTLSLTHQDAASTAANRFILPNAATLVIRPGGGCILKYDSTATRWRVQTVL